MECRICKKISAEGEDIGGWQKLETSVRIGENVMQGCDDVCPECIARYKEAKEVPENTINQDMLTAVKTRLWGILGSPVAETEEEKAENKPVDEGTVAKPLPETTQPGSEESEKAGEEKKEEDAGAATREAEAKAEAKEKEDNEGSSDSSE